MGVPHSERSVVIVSGLSAVEKPPKENPVVPIQQKISLTLEECSALTGLAVSALRSAIWAGDLSFIQSGQRKRYLIRRESLDRFLQDKEERSGQ